jgi:hypothetical protein
MTIPAKNELSADQNFLPLLLKSLTEHVNTDCWEQNIALQRRICCGGSRRMLGSA